MGTRKSIRGLSAWRVWAAGLAGGLLLVGCGGRATPLPSAEATLQQSAQVMQDLRSAHFVIERTGAPAYVDPGNTIIFRQAEGDFAAPDQARVAVRVIGPALVVEVHVVSLGDQYWETNPVTGAWVSYPGMGYNPVALFDPQTGLSALMRHSLTNLKMAGLASLDDFPGERFFHLTAEAPGDLVRAMTAGMIGRGRVTFDWWIQSVFCSFCAANAVMTSEVWDSL